MVLSQSGVRMETSQGIRRKFDNKGIASLASPACVTLKSMFWGIYQSRIPDPTHSTQEFGKLLSHKENRLIGVFLLSHNACSFNKFKQFIVQRKAVTYIGNLTTQRQTDVDILEPSLLISSGLATLHKMETVEEALPG